MGNLTSSRLETFGALSVCGNVGAANSQQGSKSASTAGLRSAMAQLQHLVSFVQTAEHGSFSAAGRVLGLTPAGVSKNVARLEADLGVRLFHRSTRLLALTESGERFLAQVDAPLAALDAAAAGARTLAA